MAEIVLLQPYVGDWDDFRTSPALPLALLHTASFVVEEFDVRLIDRRVTPDWKTQLKQAIGTETLAVCFTAHAGPVILSDLEMAEEARKLTDLPLVWGGVHCTIEPESTLADNRVDIIIRGEGEYSLLELARALKKRQSLDGIKGVWHKKNGEIIRNPDRELLDLDSLPEIPYQLVDVRRYLPLYRGRKSINLQTSRGCQHLCGFCYNTPFNQQKYRAQSAKRVIERVHLLVDKFGVEDILFVDDNFFVDMERDRAIVEGIREIETTWQLYGVDVVALKEMDDAFLKVVEESGLQRITLGVESGNARIRDLLIKAGSVEDVIEVMKKMARYNIVIFGSFMAGMPTETRAELKDTIDLIFKLLKINPHMNSSPLLNYGPQSGTMLYDLALESNYRIPKTLKEWGEISTEVSSLPDKSDREFHENLYFVSNFLDHKAYEYELPLLMRWMTDIYRPIAHWRVKNLNFKFLVEKRIADWIMPIVKKYVTQRSLT